MSTNGYHARFRQELKLVFFSYFRLVPESILWLIAKHRYSDAYSIIQKAAHWNKVQIPSEAQKLQVK